MAIPIAWWLPMSFPTHLQRGFTQQQMADAAGIHVNQIKRYAAGTTQPTLEALIKLAKTLHISLDNLVFGENERGPGDDLKLQFEAINELEEEDKHIIREVLEGLIIKYQAKRWNRISNS